MFFPRYPLLLSFVVPQMALDQGGPPCHLLKIPLPLPCLSSIVHPTFTLARFLSFFFFFLWLFCLKGRHLEHVWFPAVFPGPGLVPGAQDAPDQRLSTNKQRPKWPTELPRAHLPPNGRCLGHHLWTTSKEGAGQAAPRTQHPLRIGCYRAKNNKHRVPVVAHR